MRFVDLEGAETPRLFLEAAALESAFMVFLALEIMSHFAALISWLSLFFFSSPMGSAAIRAMHSSNSKALRTRSLFTLK